VWGLLAALLSKGGAMSIAAAFNLVLAVAIVCAFAGAWLRTWGSAYLGADVMRDTSMRSDGVVADGPYRTMRNPLYLGSWLNLLAMALLMPASGAVFAIVMLIGFQMRLILGEEAFLREKLGEPYAAYCAKVPRILPALRPQVAASGARPRWEQAALAEIFMWDRRCRSPCWAGGIRDAAASMRAGVAGRVAGGEGVCDGAGRKGCLVGRFTSHPSR